MDMFQVEANKDGEGAVRLSGTRGHCAQELTHKQHGDPRSDGVSRLTTKGIRDLSTATAEPTGLEQDEGAESLWLQVPW